MAVTEEWVYWKDESHLNLNMQGGLYPKITHSSFPTKYTKLYYCYYTSKPGQSLILAPSGGNFHRALFHPRFDFYLCSLLLQTIQTNIVLYFVCLLPSSFTNNVYPNVFVVSWNFNDKKKLHCNFLNVYIFHVCDMRLWSSWELCPVRLTKNSTEWRHCSCAVVCLLNKRRRRQDHRPSVIPKTYS